MSVDARFFLEPVQLRSQPANLGIQLVYLSFMLLRTDLGPIAVLAEQTGQTLQRNRFPTIELVRMNPLLGGNLTNGLFLLQNLLYDPSLELGSVTFSHDRYSTLFSAFCVSRFRHPL